MAEVKVLGHWASAFSVNVEIALKLKGVEYEFIQEDLPNKSPLLLKSNPVHKKIPVLLHNGNPLAESLVIIEYIDETFPGTPILPKDPYEKAMARFWAKFIDDKFFSGAKKALFIRGEGEEQEKGIEEVCEALKILDSELKNKKFLGGETIGLADLAASFIALWMGIFEEVIGVDLGVTEEKFPHLCRWKQDFLNCDFFSAARKALFIKGEEQEKGKEEICEALKILDSELKNKKFLGGETFGLADLAANFIALWMGVLEEVIGVELGVTEEKFPNLYRWKQDFLNCDLIKETFPPRDKLVAFYNKRFNPEAASATE
nr:probable glutathione S-transferase [Ipomoea batatas]